MTYVFVLYFAPFEYLVQFLLLESLIVIFHFKGSQLVNAGTYNVMQPMQTVTVDGQEALFIPAAMAGGQPQPVQQLFTPTGQIIRAPGILPTNILQNMAGQTVQLPAGR